MNPEKKKDLKKKLKAQKEKHKATWTGAAGQFCLAPELDALLRKISKLQDDLITSLRDQVVLLVEVKRLRAENAELKAAKIPG